MIKLLCYREKTKNNLLKEFRAHYPWVKSYLHIIKLTWNDSSQEDKRPDTCETL